MSEIYCPSCGSEVTGKDGLTKEGVQRYKCKNCGKRMTANTVVHNINGIKNIAENEMDISHKIVTGGWVKTENGSFQFRNPEYEEVEKFDYDSIDWDLILPKVSRIEIELKTIEVAKFDRAVITDVHAGMKIEKNSQYGGIWNRTELMACAKEMCDFIIANRKAPILRLDELGDLADGWDAQTVRKGHKLPQNMDNVEAFECCVEFYLYIFSRLTPYFTQIVVSKVIKDNHSGDFGKVIAIAVKRLSEIMYSNVKFNILDKFMEHYTIGQNTFILCHGKDDKNMKYGLKPKLDAKNLQQIDNYIDTNYLMQKGHRIEFSKGDSHVEVFDKEFPVKFDYACYPAFSPR